ncbi:MAG: hypothetical protein U0176_08835 [Bacteroidia bacterium]
MKEFLKKVGLRLAILAGIWVVFTQVLPKRLYLGPEYSRWETVFGHLESLKAAPRHVNLVLGDSRPEMGLASQHLRAWNYGLGGTSPVEGYYMLKQLQDVPIDTLYLSYSPYHFHYQDCFHNRSEHFGFIDPGYIAEVESLSTAVGDTVFQWNNPTRLSTTWMPTSPPNGCNGRSGTCRRCMASTTGNGISGNGRRCKPRWRPAN